MSPPSWTISKGNVTFQSSIFWGYASFEGVALHIIIHQLQLILNLFTSIGGVGYSTSMFILTPPGKKSYFPKKRWYLCNKRTPFWTKLWEHGFGFGAELERNRRKTQYLSSEVVKVEWMIHREHGWGPLKIGTLNHRPKNIHLCLSEYLYGTQGDQHLFPMIVPQDLLSNMMFFDLDHPKPSLSTFTNRALNWWCRWYYYSCNTTSQLWRHLYT